MTASPDSRTQARTHPPSNAAAAQYAANRPSCPSALLDTVETLTVRPPRHRRDADRPPSRRRPGRARVADIGAGTGTATALLHARGARVVAVEPGEGMAAQLRRGLPDVPLVRGDGNHLPLATASLDLLAYAQSWHWTDPALTVPEALRVLRPVGAPALWWNTGAVDVPWIDAQADRVRRHFGIDHVVRKNGDGSRAALADPTGGLDSAHRPVRGSRRVPLDLHLANISSHPAFLVHAEESTAAFLAEEHRHLLAAFPDGTIEETYDVELLLATTPHES
ncbi:class I SAM-dependent methyltransferase [Streptomyces griseoruber]|uniref:class I SAM-dependent methyltransferase n=1 Tax=Streptomyces griseoruber TaxID=1943 RepID=UPI0037916D91